MNADLSEVELSVANLRGTNLSRANLRLANLETAKLLEADLRLANLEGTDLWYADLRGADLMARKIGAQLAFDPAPNSATQRCLTATSTTKIAISPVQQQSKSEVEVVPSGEVAKKKLLETKECVGCDLSRLDMFEINLQGADLQGAEMSFVNLILADLRKLILKEPTFRW